MLENHIIYQRGQRFYIKIPGTDTIKIGTVLHRRTMYGGPPYVYMVKYDDPKYKEHNAYGQFMKVIN